MTSATGDFDLERFDDVYEPEKAGQFDPGPEILPDGDYDFVILGGSIGPAGTDKVLRLKLQVLGGPHDGDQLTRTSFINSNDAVNHIGKDFKTLEFDADKWKPVFGRRFSVELPAAVAKVRGIRFKAKKTSSPGTDKKTGAAKTFHNIYINKKLAESGIPGVPDQPNGQPGTDPDDPFGE
jgi:hypothetical protein